MKNFDNNNHAAAAAAKSFQSCPFLCYLMDFSLPGFSVCGFTLARIVEQVAIFSSKDNLPNPGIIPASPASAGGFFPIEQPQGSNVYVHFGFVAKHIW